MKAKLLFSLSLLSFLTARAQNNLGIATSNYSAINSLYLNPAGISGCNEKIVINIVSLNIGVDNNLGTFTKISNIGNGNTNVFNVSGNSSFSMLAPALDAHLPAILVSLNDKLKQSFALTTRVRAINQFNNFDPDLYSTITSSNHNANGDYNYQSSNFNWTAHVWSEIGLTYALQILDNGPHKLRAGVTLRYLGGIDYLSLKGSNLNVSYKQGNDTFYASHSDLEFASNAISSNSAVNNGVQTSDILSSVFNSKSGSGVGMDIGLTYTYLIGSPDPNGNINDGHKLTASLCVRDIGAIKYNEGNFVVNVTGNGYLTGTGLSNNINNYSDFRNYMAGQGFTADTGSKPTKVYMPTALVAGLDYQVYNRFYANATLIANLANRQNYGNSYYTQFTVTPRYDTRLFSFGLPITYGTLAKDVKVGFGIRFSGFFIGSDDMMALFSNNQHGLNLFFGGYVPLYRKTHKHTEPEPEPVAVPESVPQAAPAIVPEHVPVPEGTDKK